MNTLRYLPTSSIEPPPAAGLKNATAAEERFSRGLDVAPRARATKVIRVCLRLRSIMIIE